MFASIAIFSTIKKFFDYEIPLQIINNAKPGSRVVIPFGNNNKIIIGIIIAVSNQTTCPKDKLKTIIEILDPEPIINEPLLQTYLWGANYYQVPIGAILDCALPKALKINTIYSNLNNKKNLNNKINNTKTKPKELNQAQQIALDNIILNSSQFNINLLDGVTGSGKTEIYLRLTEYMITNNKQTLILVPEIGLTPQIYTRFQQRFPNHKIAILHSNIATKQRYLNWLNAKNSEALIIIGTRLACFVPLLKPGIFIIDEEHDLSFKQQDSVRYMARDLLIMRAKLTGCPIVLGTATPSLETFYNAKQQKYNHYILPNRVNSILPDIKLVDIRHKKLTAGLSNLTIEAIKQQLLQNNQVLLFINRRGFAPIIKCLSCNFSQKCTNCDANLNLHIYTNKLHCHHCHIILDPPKICPSCNNNNLTPIGQGTERIEQLLQQLFPEANIARIDRDSTAKKQDFNQMLTDIIEQKINILVGTQMLAKGHHFPKLNLVVIIDADSALFSSDFRAIERLGQLILQVAGRAGREQQGQVLLQTSYPNNKFIQYIIKYNYHQLALDLLEERREAELPPFSHQVLWRTESNSINTSIKLLTKIKSWAKNFNHTCKIFGPIPAVMEKRKKKYHARLLLQHTNRIILQKINKYLLDLMLQQKISSSVRWSIDVDPKESF